MLQSIMKKNMNFKKEKARVKRRYLRKRKTFLKKMRALNKVLKCEFCGSECHENYYKSPKYLTVDHLIPLSKDFDLAVNFNNFVIACKCCNEQKGDNQEIIIKEKVMNIYPDEWKLTPLYL
jgi:5-methylcytosine-specific restriction endonuclease McrA